MSPRPPCGPASGADPRVMAGGRQTPKLRMLLAHALERYPLMPMLLEGQKGRAAADCATCGRPRKFVATRQAAARLTAARAGLTDSDDAHFQRFQHGTRAVAHAELR